MSDLCFLADTEWRQKIEEWQSMQRVCVRCGVKYAEIDNIGTWKCYQHVRPANLRTYGTFHPVSTFDCCGRSNNLNKPFEPCGCIRADHTILPIPYNHRHDIPINFAIVNLFSVCKEAIVPTGYETDRNDTFVVRRYDWIETAKRTNTGNGVDSWNQQGSKYDKYVL